jgi:hypothetical protein
MRDDDDEHHRRRPRLNWDRVALVAFVALQTTIIVTLVVALLWAATMLASK